MKNKMIPCDGVALMNFPLKNVKLSDVKLNESIQSNRSIHKKWWENLR